MNQTSCGDDRDNARPQRHFVIEEDDIGTAPFRENAAIGQARRPGRRSRYQVPRLGERQYTVGVKSERRQQLRRIIIVGGENRAKTLGDHVGRLGPSGMAAAAHDIGRAEHNEITPLSGFARGFLIDRKFGDADALCPKAPSHRRACIVMREHAHIG